MKDVIRMFAKSFISVVPITTTGSITGSLSTAINNQIESLTTDQIEVFNANIAEMNAAFTEAAYDLNANPNNATAIIKAALGSISGIFDEMDVSISIEDVKVGADRTILITSSINGSRNISYYFVNRVGLYS